MEVGAAVRPRLTVDGLREMIHDLTRAGHRPQAVLLSEYDRRELIEDLCAASVVPVSKDDEKNQAAMIPVVEGVQVMAHPDVARGSCRVVMKGT